METVILVIHLIVALSLIGVVLLQRSEGGALGIGGGGGGGGGAGSLFSARGVGNALTRTTAWLAVGFFCTSIALTVIATQRGSGSVIDGVAAPAANGEAPTAPAQGSGDSTVLPKLAPATPQVPVSP